MLNEQIDSVLLRLRQKHRTIIIHPNDGGKYAKQLLAEAGYPDGKGLPSLTLATTANYADLCKYIQQQLNLLGFNIKVDVNPPASLREQMAQGKSAWFRGSWIADYPDAETYLSLSPAALFISFATSFPPFLIF